MSKDGNPEEVPPGTTGSGENVCRTCEGTGQVQGKACVDCDGTGKVVTPLGGG